MSDSSPAAQASAPSSSPSSSAATAAGPLGPPADSTNTAAAKQGTRISSGQEDGQTKVIILQPRIRNALPIPNIFAIFILFFLLGASYIALLKEPLDESGGQSSFDQITLIQDVDDQGLDYNPSLVRGADDEESATTPTHRPSLRPNTRGPSSLTANENGNDDDEHAPVKTKLMLDALKGKSIAAFGDDWTSGVYHSKGATKPQYKPYSFVLSEMCKGKTSVVNYGSDDSETTLEMEDRMNTLFANAKKTNIRAVIIFAGKNDVMNSHVPPIDATQTVANIIELHKRAQSFISGPNLMVTIAVTLPEWRNSNETARLLINQGIRDYVKQCQYRVALVDLEKKFSLRVKNNAIFWSEDKKTFSPQGYDLIGKLIFDAMSATDVEVWDTKNVPEYVCSGETRRR